MPTGSLELGRVHCVDCIDGMAQLPPGMVDLAFADPPFNIGYEYDGYSDNRELADYLDWCKSWMAAVYRTLKADGTFWLAIGDEYAAELKLLAQKVGFRPRSWVIWHYTFGVNCKRKFTRSHTHLLYFVKDAKLFTFRADSPAVRVPSNRQRVYNDKRANPAGRLPDDTWLFPRIAGTFKDRAKFHGCQMPEKLLGRIVESCSQPGDLVLDPFSGSASTLVVAKKLDRRFVGFELSESYAVKGQDRIDAANAGDPLAGSDELLTMTIAELTKRRPRKETIHVD